MVLKNLKLHVFIHAIIHSFMYLFISLSHIVVTELLTKWLRIPEVGK